jgi:hypothetical protein
MSTDDAGRAAAATAPASGSGPVSAEAFAADAHRILDQVQGILSRQSVDEIPDQAAQDLLLAAVRLFSAKRDAGAGIPAFPEGSVTATDVAVTAVAMTQVVNLELFELALWHGWSNI